MTRLHAIFIAGAALAMAAHAQTTGTVEGKVINTANGRAVAGAIVVLQGSEPTGDPPRPDSYVVETDAQGRFRVEGVAPSRYDASPQREGFAARIYPPFTVEAGQHVQDINLRLIPLGAISGRVLDTDGDPVSNALVLALRYSYVDGKKELKTLGQGRSNDRGEYRIAGLAPGRCYLKFSPDLLSRRWLNTSLRILGPKPEYDFAATYFPAASDLARAVSLDVPPGGELPDNNILLDPDHSYTIRVTLAANQAGPSTPMVGISTPSGMGGAFSARYGSAHEFPNLAPGTYSVRGLDAWQGLFVEQVVEVVNSDVDVTLTLRPELTIDGIVQVEAGARVAVDGVRVKLEGDEPSNNREAAAKPDGTFTIQHVQQTAYQVRVTIPAGGYLKSLRLGKRILASPRIDLAQAAGALSIAVGGDGGKLEGTVMSVQGAPIEGAAVVAVPDGPLRDWADLARSAVAGREGKFEVRDLAPGDYRVFAWEDAEPGAPLDADFRKPFEKQAASVRMAANGRETIQLKAISVVEGK
jgi:hypothetical protein